MTGNARLQTPIVRLPLQSNLDANLDRGAKVAMIVIALLATAAALSLAKVVVAPIALAVVIGLMFGPVARRVEKLGVAPSLSAGLVLVIFLALIAAALALCAAPVAEWVDRLPIIWAKLRNTVDQWRQPLEVMGIVQDEIRTIAGGDASMEVTVDDGGTVRRIAFLAPVFVAQLAIFLASLYFFVATRDHIRNFILSLCVNRRLRWRAAHVFRDVEVDVSRYLISITAINAGLGVAVAIAMSLIGIPLPIFWGALAAALNYIVYLGPALLAILLLGAGLATFDNLGSIVLPAVTFLTLNMIEAQFVTPLALGRRLLLNPFLVLVSVAFWLWLWGPIGGFVAVPFMLIVHAVIRNIVPRWLPDVP